MNEFNFIFNSTVRQNKQEENWLEKASVSKVLEDRGSAPYFALQRLQSFNRRFSAASVIRLVHQFIRQPACCFQPMPVLYNTGQFEIQHATCPCTFYITGTTQPKIFSAGLIPSPEKTWFSGVFMRFIAEPLPVNKMQKLFTTSSHTSA